MLSSNKTRDNYSKAIILALSLTINIVRILADKPKYLTQDIYINEMTKI